MKIEITKFSDGSGFSGRIDGISGTDVGSTGITFNDCVTNLLCDAQDTMHKLRCRRLEWERSPYMEALYDTLKRELASCGF